MMCPGQHYVPACKYSSFVPLIQSPFRFMFIAFKCSWMRSDSSIPWSDVCILWSDGYLWFLLVNSIFTSFPVHRIDGVDSSGQVTTVTYSLSPDSVTIARGYDAMREDPNIYKTLDFCGYLASKHFPDMHLPVPGAPSVSDST